MSFISFLDLYTHGCILISDKDREQTGTARSSEFIYNYIQGSDEGIEPQPVTLTYTTTNITTMNEITYVTLKERTLIEKVWFELKWFYYNVLNTVTRYDHKHPEYGTYSPRDLAHMTKMNKRAMAGKSWKR
jgi:hypothetical protein